MKGRHLVLLPVWGLWGWALYEWSLWSLLIVLAGILLYVAANALNAP